MPETQPIPAVTFRARPGEDISDRIAPPYDVLTPDSKAALLRKSEHNIAAIDLPHLPAKTVGPDETYVQAGQRYRDWLAQGVLTRRDTPAIFLYQQTYTVAGTRFQRRGIIANVRVQPFGPGKDGKGGIFPHEETFSAAKEDRLKLMRATRAQLSPIFGLYSDPSGVVGELIDRVRDGYSPTFHGTTDDGTLHEVWAVDRPDQVEQFQVALADKDIFIADGHHRYNTALNYKAEAASTAPSGSPGAGADWCLFVLVSMQDPGMIVLPTHRVLGNMPRFDFNEFVKVAEGRLKIEPVLGTDLQTLQHAVEEYAHPHAIGLYNPAHPQAPLHIATVVEPDPLARTHGNKSDAWRQLDVAIVQHLIVEQLCEPNFCEPGQKVAWKFPHALDDFKQIADSDGYQLGLLLRATPLDAVRRVSEAGELMPQKSTFFYPKLATGLVINPLD